MAPLTFSESLSYFEEESINEAKKNKNKNHET